MRIVPEGGEHPGGQRVHLFQAYVVKIGLAGALRAIAAHAHAEGHLALVLSRFAVPLKVLPFSIRIKQAIGIRVNALDAQVCAVAGILHGFHQHVGAQAIERGRLHRNGAGIARIVGAGVFHHGAVLAAVRLFRRDGNARIPLLRAVGRGIPTLRIPGRIQRFKAAVGDQIGFLRGGGQAHQQRQRQAKKGADAFHSAVSSPTKWRRKVRRCAGVGPWVRSAAMCSAVP